MIYIRKLSKSSLWLRSQASRAWAKCCGAAANIIAEPLRKTKIIKKTEARPNKLSQNLQKNQKNQKNLSSGRVASPSPRLRVWPVFPQSLGFFGFFGFFEGFGSLLIKSLWFFWFFRFDRGHHFSPWVNTDTWGRAHYRWMASFQPLSEHRSLGESFIAALEPSKYHIRLDSGITEKTWWHFLLMLINVLICVCNVFCTICRIIQHKLGNGLCCENGTFH